MELLSILGQIASTRLLQVSTVVIEGALQMELVVEIQSGLPYSEQQHLIAALRTACSLGAVRSRF